MTRLSISTTAALLMISFAPTANAYGTDPAPETLGDISEIALTAFDTTTADGTCQIDVTPELATILGLPDDWRTGGDAYATAVACNGDS